MDNKVRDLDKLLSEHLNAEEVLKDVSYSRLTQPGDNYGSIMLKVDVTITNKATNTVRVLNIVAKTLPELEYIRQIFKIQTTYTNEMAFYNVVAPTVQKYRKDSGLEPIENFAKCYGTRKNLLENSDIINDDAVLLLDNLKERGYVNVDRKIGFDLDTIKLVLTDIARFHASFLALKLQKPEVFQTNVRPYCNNYEPPEFNPNTRQFIRKVFNEISKEDDDCANLASKVKFWGEILRSEPREPFATVIHTDLWTNNTMQSFTNGKATSNKFVDFQVYTFGSPAADVFFVLWTSVQMSVLETHLDHLLQFYHELLVKNLKELRCDTAPFSYDEFLKELKLEAEYEFPHSIEFLFILGLAADESTFFGDYMDAVKTAPKHFKEKMWYMVKECYRRGWLY